ncbi:MAG: TIM barrel protein [Acidobacteriaceae bacterium]|nr:TIM barrel protein [Acidobacteriaceae bacterium]MBV9294027.1 TIM barrel protein [Acidobacteriaceae bacterium]MBV9767868.1 TIM barrel protein [Acidobacteriaceae bacterium]
MNRRTFSKSLAGAAAIAGALEPSRSRAAAQDESPAPFNFSIMLWTVFKDLSFERRLEKVVEAGYKNVELVGEYHNWSVLDFNSATAKRKQLGITFDTTAGLKHGIGNPSDRDAMLADLQHELPIMEKLDCPAVIIMSGNVVPGMPRETQHQSCIEGLKKAASIVEGKQIHGQPVRLLLENIDPEENKNYYLTSVAEGFEIIRAVNHPQVQFLYDFFHEQIAEGNLIEKLEKNIQYTGLVHIADVPGRHEPGTGEINYESIYRKLAQLKYDRMVAMEFLPTGDPVAKLRAAREQALNAARI